MAGSRYVLRAIPVGLVTLTADPEVFADAVWRACGSDDLTSQEFQAAALIAAAVSLGLDWKFDWNSNESLCSVQLAKSWPLSSTRHTDP